jgi:hypothetical protein
MSLVRKKVCSAAITRIERRVRLVAAYTQILVFGSLAALPFNSKAGQFVEITAEIRGTNWYGFAGRNYNSNVRCVVGTNRWYMAEDTTSSNLGGYRLEYLFTGSNILERFLFKDKSRMQDRTTNVYDLPNGGPVGPDPVGVGWLAFCSGPYLKQAGRVIPLPARDLFLTVPDLDKTAVFDDGLGLPKSMELYTTNGQRVCQYQVLESTNFLGWTFPSRFKLTESGPRGTPFTQSSWYGLDLVLFGELMSIRAATAPHLTPGTN